MMMMTMITYHRVPARVSFSSTYHVFVAKYEDFFTIDFTTAVDCHSLNDTPQKRLRFLLFVDSFFYGEPLPILYQIILFFFIFVTNVDFYYCFIFIAIILNFLLLASFIFTVINIIIIKIRS